MADLNHFLFPRITINTDNNYIDNDDNNNDNKK